MNETIQILSVSHYVTLCTILFSIGVLGVLLKRNAIIMFMCIELMLNAVNLSFVAFSKANGNLDGQLAVFFVMVVAAAEAAVGLAIIISLFRTMKSVETTESGLLKG